MTELKVTKEKVLGAAEKCSEAKEILMALFPEVFEEKKEWKNITTELTFHTIPASAGRSIIYAAWLGKNLLFFQKDGIRYSLGRPHGYDYKIEGVSNSIAVYARKK